jgi:hypothetical protein
MTKRKSLTTRRRSDLTDSLDSKTASYLSRNARNFAAVPAPKTDNPHLPGSGNQNENPATDSERNRNHPLSYDLQRPYCRFAEPFLFPKRSESERSRRPVRELKRKQESVISGV